MNRDIQLLSRNATGWLFTGIFCVVPFVIAAFLAHLFFTWPGFIFTNGPGPLICCVMNLTLAMTMFTIYKNPHARRLCTFGIVVGITNIDPLILCLPSSEYSVWLYRLGTSVYSLMPITYYAYWRGYFIDDEPRSDVPSRIISITAWAMAALSLTPFVIGNLAFSSKIVNTAEIVPGPLHPLFSLWILAIMGFANIWPSISWWKSTGRNKAVVGFLMFTSFFMGVVAVTTYSLFIEGKIRWYWYPLSEFFSVLCQMIALIYRLPIKEGVSRKTWTKKLGSFFAFVFSSSVVVGILFTQDSHLTIFMDGILFLTSVGFIMSKIREPIQDWVDRTFVFRDEFGHVAMAKEMVQKEWNLDSLEEALPLVAREVLKNTPYRACTIAIMFEDQPKRPFFRSTQLHLAQGDTIAGMPWSEELVMAFLHMVREDRSLWRRDMIKHLPPVIAALDPLLFEAVVPLESNGKIEGVVVVGPKVGKKSGFNDEDIKILSALAGTLSQRLGPSVGLNLFRCVVNNTLHDVLGQDIGPLVDQLSMGYPLTKDMTLRGLRQIRDGLKGLRSYAQGELDKGHLRELDPLNVETVLTAVFNLHRVAAEKKGLAFYLTIGASLPKIRVSPTLLERCVGNLVTNAIKYTPTGWIKLSAQVDGAALKICMTDSGIGIPAESLGRVFEEGYRVPGEAAAVAEGSGVGLANVQELMVAMGGRASVESSPGKGSEFILTLSLQKA